MFHDSQETLRLAVVYLDRAHLLNERERLDRERGRLVRLEQELRDRFKRGLLAAADRHVAAVHDAKRLGESLPDKDPALLATVQAYLRGEHA